MVKPEKIILDKKTFLLLGKSQWILSVDNVGSCGSLPGIIEEVRALGKCSAEAIANLINHFAPVEIAAGQQLELF